MLVAVTSRASAKERSLLEQTFAGLVDLRFTRDLPADARMQVLRDAEVILGWHPQVEAGAKELSECRNLRLVQLISAGADHLNPAAFPGEPLFASNAGAFAGPMAEHVLAMALALQKHLLPGHEGLRRGEFDRVPSRELGGSTVGIVGYGGIGRAVAEIFRPFRCRVLAINRSGEIADPVDFIGTLGDLQFVLSQSDIVVLTLPLTPSTRGLLGRRELSWLRGDSILINVARGPLVDEEALYDHLIEHPDTLAGIDVWWEEPRRGDAFSTRRPLLDLPNVVGSPHNSGRTDRSRYVATQRAASNVLRFLRKEPLQGLLSREDLFAS